MPKTHQKCQIAGSDSIVDNMFVCLSQTYLMNAILRNSQRIGADNKKNKMKVLELGCFNGRLMEMMTQWMVILDYTGVDVRKEYYINSKMYKRKTGTRFIEQDITSGLPQVANDSQDMVVSSETLEHIEAANLPIVIQTLRDKLKPGGRLILSFPMNTRDKCFHRLEKEKNLGHVHFPVHEDFIELCTNLGLQLVKFDSGYTLKSSYPCNHKSMKENPVYKKLASTIGTRMARAIWMILIDDHTGGGYYTFTK